MTSTPDAPAVPGAADHPIERTGTVVKRFSVNLRKRDADRLYDIATMHDVTPSEVIRRAIATEHKLVTAAEEGARIYVEHKKGRVRELDLNY